MKNRTSISDYDRYKTVCKNAYENEESFRIFKQNLDYKVILEHVSFEQGDRFIDRTLENNNINYDYINKFKENDIYGTPDLFTYRHPFGLISPSTLRYVKVLSDLIYN